MSLASEIIARRMGLTRAQTLDLVCEQDLRTEMDDGAVLLADRWVAREAADLRQPTVLVRSPYGRRQFVGLLFGRLLAERGLQVVIQSVRGTFGSQGSFAPFDERADGLATLRWLRRQPWHADRIGMIGPSYLGFVQWAVAPEAGADLAAMAIQVSASQFYEQTYSGGSLALENVGSWMAVVSAQERRSGLLAINRTLRRLASMLSELPLSDLDERAIGTRVAWFREGFAHAARDDAYWAARDFSPKVPQVAAPVQFVGGWYDILLPWMLDDFSALRGAGKDPQLRIGPWTHTSPALMGAGHRDGIAWLRSHLLDDQRLVRDFRVRVLITGERSGGGWRNLDDWPPPGTTQHRLWLGERWTLHSGAPVAGAAGNGDRYRYDPSDPTPSLGGPGLLSRHPVPDNRELEARDDVLTYSTEPLPATVEALGPVAVELWFRASSEHFDVFARVCDVDADGASWNVCDGLVSVEDSRFERSPDGVWRVAFSLWPMGHRCATGHRIRLQVSSGAHPRYARNPGTGEDRITATALLPVELEVLRDAERPSALVLPATGP